MTAVWTADSDHKQGGVPESVRSALRGDGEPLSTAERTYAESRFGFDFSDVRVFDDPASARSAAEIGARAYTFGSRVVFGSGVRENGARGRNTLAHELTHVLQQPRVAAEPRGVAQSHASAELNPSAPADPGLIHRDATGSASTLPPVPNYQLSNPTLHRERQRRPSLVPALGPHLLPEDLDKINAFLALHGFSVGSTFQPMFDMAPSSIDAIVNAAYGLVLPIIPLAEVRDYVQRMYQAKVWTAISTPLALPDLTISGTSTPAPSRTESGAASGGGGGGDGPQIAIGTTTAYHLNVTGPPGSNGDTVVQVQLTTGEGIQQVIQAQYNVNNGQVQVLGGAQYTSSEVTLTRNLFGIAKLIVTSSAFVQVLAGAAWSGAPATGTFVVVQPQVGAQITIKYGKLQFIVQAAISFTGQFGRGAGPSTLDVNASPQLQGPQGSPFTLGPLPPVGGGAGLPPVGGISVTIPIPGT